MTAAKARTQISERGLNPNEVNIRLSNHGAAGRLMAARNKQNRRFASGHTFTMEFTCGHKSIIQVEADDAGAQEVPNPCGNYQVFGVFG